MHRNLTFSLIVFLPWLAVGHSWVEQVQRAHQNGTHYGGTGFIRGYVPRSDPRFQDARDTDLLPPNDSDRSYVDDTDLICSESQRQFDSQNALFVAAGDSVLFKYNENGHITMPWASPSKSSSGRVYIYGTDNPHINETITNVHNVWRPEVTKGVGKGSLLTVVNFDDDKCFQYSGLNTSNIESERFAAFGPGSTQPAEGLNRWCTNMITLPMIMFKPSYTIYWVWDYSDRFGKTEIYTSCLDLLIA